MNHEIAELREAATGRAGKVDVLKRGALEPGAVLSGHDAGRVAELAWLAGKLERTGSAGLDAELRHEIHALIEDLGLRKGMVGAEKRYGPHREPARPEAKPTLERMRAKRSNLTAEDAVVLRHVRRQRLHDLKAGLELRTQPLRPMTSLKRPGDPEVRCRARAPVPTPRRRVSFVATSPWSLGRIRAAARPAAL